MSGPGGPGWRISIRAKLALLIGSVAALVVVVLTSAQVWFNSQRLWETVNNDLLRTTALVGSQVDSFVSNTVDELRVLAADPAVAADLEANDTDRMSARLAAWIGNDPDLLNMVVLDRNGVIFATSQPDRTSLIGMRLDDEIQVRSVLSFSLVAVGEPRPGLLSGQPIVPLAVAVRNGSGQTVGALQAGLSLERLSSFMDSVLVGREGYASLLTGDGIILTNPNRQRILSRAAGVNEAVAAAREGRTAVAETTNTAGVRIIASATVIPSLGWIVQAQRPREEAIEPVRAELARAGLIGSGLLLATVLVSTMAAHYATTSITRLRQASERWAEGDLAHQAQVRGSDELSQLAQSFNQMAVQLREARDRNEDLLATIDGERATLNHVMEGMSDGLLVADAARGVRFFNHRASVLLGLDLQAFVGRPASDVFTHSLPLCVDPVAAESAWRMLYEEADTRPTAEIARCGPPQVDLLAQSFPVAAADGSSVGFLIHDVTADRDLIRTKDELVSVVSHELRTPLASLLGFAELMLTRPYTEERRALYLQTMLTEGKRLTALINDFLDLQRMEIGRQPIQFEPTDLRQVLERSIASAGPDDAHPVIVDAPATFAPVTADADRVQQVIGNLISNGRKYCPGEGAIRIKMRVVDDSVELAVTDRGLGLPPEAQAKLFQKFYRVDNSDRREIKGTGLGLAICKQIVEAHGGRIWASSDGLGQGSTFAFTLPIERVAVA